MHQCRAEINLLHGDIGAATSRRQQVDAIIGHTAHIDIAREAAQQAAELAVWAGRPAEALKAVRRVLPLFITADLTILCGRLLTTGMRACADLAAQARARRDQPALDAALPAASDLAAWVDQMARAPFTGHPFVATIPAERATWDAERTRLAGASDPAAWAAAGKAWRDLGCPHRAGYAWWRQAQAQLEAGQPASAAVTALRAAAAAAAGHAPLRAQVRALAERARIPLEPPAAAPVPAGPRPPPWLSGPACSATRAKDRPRKPKDSSAPERRDHPIRAARPEPHPRDKATTEETMMHPDLEIARNHMAVAAYPRQTTRRFKEVRSFATRA